MSQNQINGKDKKVKSVNIKSPVKTTSGSSGYQQRADPSPVRSRSSAESENGSNSAIAEGFVFISVTQLTQLMGQVVRTALQEQAAMFKTSTDGPLTIKECSEYTKIPVGTIHQLTSQRKIPHEKPGRSLLFYKDELDEWIKSKRRPTREEIKENSYGLKGKRKG